MALLVVLFNVW